MDSVKLVPLLVGLLIAVVMVGAVFVPVVQSSTTRIVTTEIENEGAEWLKLGYNQGTDYSFTVGFDGEDNFTVGTQTGEYKNLICYADNERSLFVSGDYWYLLTNGENPSVHKFTDNASVTNASGTLTILDGSETVYTGVSPTWAYVPDSNGVYGFFTEGGLNLEEGKPKVAVGSYAGVFAYNETVVAPNDLGTLGLTMSGDYAEGEVNWVLTPEELSSLSVAPTDTLEPAVLDLEPISLDPIDLGGDSGGVGLMMATPTYTDGVWGFDLVNGNARIVSYTGSYGDIVVPETVTTGGVTYNVTEIGYSQAVFNTTDSFTIQFNDNLEKIGNNAFKTTKISGDLVIPDSVISIGEEVFYGCSDLNGTLTLGDSIQSIGKQAFRDAGLTGHLIIPDSVTSLGFQAFYNCQFDGDLVIPDSIDNLNVYTFAYVPFDGVLVLPDTLTNVANGGFNNTDFYGLINLSSATFTTCFTDSGIREVLNFGGTEFDTTSYGLNADSVQDYVSALGYIAPTLITETEVIPIDSPVAGLMQMLPLIAGIGALFLAVGTMIYTRF